MFEFDEPQFVIHVTYLLKVITDLLTKGMDNERVSALKKMVKDIDKLVYL